MKYEIKYEQRYWGTVNVEAENELEAREKATTEIESGDNADILDSDITLLECNGKEIL